MHQNIHSLLCFIVQKIQMFCAIAAFFFPQTFLRMEIYIPSWINTTCLMIAVMDNFGEADTKQWTESPSPHSNSWTVNPLSTAICCTSSCRYSSISGFNIFHRPHHMVVDITHASPIMYKFFFHTHSITWGVKTRNEKSNIFSISYMPITALISRAGRLLYDF